MKIKGKRVYIYDIEVFSNCFHCSIKDSKTKERFHFEISVRKNQYSELYQFFTHCDDKLICGYNCIHYDNPIINFLIENYLKFRDYTWAQLCIEIKDLSDLIINSETSAPWRKWKYAKNFLTLDLLTMLFSEKQRVGLKEMEVTMQFHNVQEYEGDFNQPIPVTDIDAMIQYNDNDVDATEELLFRCTDNIKLRLGIEKEYGLNVLSMDGVSIGKEILKTKYLQDTGKTWDQIKDLRSPCEHVALSDVILDKISFEDPILQQLLVEMKSLTVDPGIKGWNKHFLFHEQEISIGVGGLHSINDSEKIIPNDDEVIKDVDATSLYPTLLIIYKFYPQHLGEEFLTTYSNIKQERVEAKRNGNKVKNETLKLALNAVTGLMQNEYSWMYSPKDVMRIRMNGQLFLLKLAEILYKNLDCQIFNWNTDGLFVKLKKQDLDKYEKAVKEFEQLSLLTMESEDFESMFQISVNDYIAVKKGYTEIKNKFLSGVSVIRNEKTKTYYTSLEEIESDFIKQKGCLMSKIVLGKGMQSMIIPKAITEFFVNGISYQDTIRNCTNINDFITYQKVGKEFQVEYNDKNITRINRYYVAKNAYYLYKYKLVNNEKKYTNLLKGFGVKIVNDLTIVSEFPTDIDYNYYIGECKKIIDKFLYKQLNLF